MSSSKVRCHSCAFCCRSFSRSSMTLSHFHASKQRAMRCTVILFSWCLKIVAEPRRILSICFAASFCNFSFCFFSASLCWLSMASFLQCKCQASKTEICNCLVRTFSKFDAAIPDARNALFCSCSLNFLIKVSCSLRMALARRADSSSAVCLLHCVTIAESSASLSFLMKSAAIRCAAPVERSWVSFLSFRIVATCSWRNSLARRANTSSAVCCLQSVMIADSSAWQSFFQKSAAMRCAAPTVRCRSAFLSFISSNLCSFSASNIARPACSARAKRCQSRNALCRAALQSRFKISSATRRRVASERCISRSLWRLSCSSWSRLASWCFRWSCSSFTHRFQANMADEQRAFESLAMNSSAILRDCTTARCRSSCLMCSICAQCSSCTCLSLCLALSSVSHCSHLATAMRSVAS
mmetsp:Transcript_141900/g.360353  ORF Transcript_141900/g.360353 Transcript_141900/m.360353 type:complete len:412 (+) Transcript_141900:1853-3088(+)